MHVLTQQNLYFTVSAEVRMKYKSLYVSHSKALNLEGWSLSVVADDAGQ